ncbi:MAG TPA: hypothetical protein VI299_16530 [Polyangiales bacterium]
MEERVLPGLGREFLAEGGRLALYASGPLLLARFSGFGVGDFAMPIIQKFEAIWQSDLRVEVFFDLGRMPNYHSDLRTRLTAHFAQRLQHIASFHVFTSSRLVAMGVSVANLALGHMITLHPTFERFRDQFDTVVRNTRTARLNSSVFAD